MSIQETLKKKSQQALQAFCQYADIEDKHLETQVGTLLKSLRELCGDHNLDFDKLSNKSKEEEITIDSVFPLKGAVKAQAESEGWTTDMDCCGDLIVTASGNNSKFKDDVSVWDFILKLAMRGSGIHKAFVKTVKKNMPFEYKLFINENRVMTRFENDTYLKLNQEECLANLGLR